MEMNNENDKNLVLKKKINTFKNGKGVIRDISDSLVVEVLRSWENYTGTARSFYLSIGLTTKQFTYITEKAKKVVKGNTDKIGSFIPVAIKDTNEQERPYNKVPIILNWDRKKIIKFYSVAQLVEFLKIAA
jgi:hypothetical protein